MTLILSFLTESCVLQVADRRVTGGGEPKDDAANKSILFFAKDAIVSVGYSGLAEIDKLPTDHWIAQQLSGEDIPVVSKGAPWTTTRFPPPANWPTIGTALDRLQERLESVFARLPGNRRARQQVVLAGWQRRKERAHPVVYEISNQESLTGRDRFTRKSLPRRWHYERKRDSVTGNQLRPIRLWYIPDSTPLKPRELQVLAEKIAFTAPLDQCRRLMVDAIRTASRRSSIVGPDCMSILIPTPRNKSIVVEYDPAKPIHAYVEHAGRQIPFIGTYGPWILAPTLIQPPLLATGPYSATIGQFVVSVAGPFRAGPIDAGDGTTIVGAMGPQPRPLWWRSGS